MFHLFFERTADAVWLLDPITATVLDCNEAAATLMSCGSKSDLVRLRMDEISLPMQPDELPTADSTARRIAATLTNGNSRFEWLARRLDGTAVQLEVKATTIERDGKPLLVLVSREISDRKKAEKEIRRLNALLERRVAERTSELVQANEQLKGEITERRRQEKIQQATYQISEAVHTAADLPSFYARVHAIVKTLMPARNFYIALLDRSTETISFPYFVDEFADEWPAPRPIGTGLTGVVLRTGKPLLADRAMSSRARRVGEALLLEGVDVPYVEAGRQAAVWLGAPLMSQGRAFGAMAVQDYGDEQGYGQGEKQILTFVAEQTALAIERKRTEQELRKRSQQVQKHRDVLLGLAQADKSDFNRALQNICSLAAATLDVARVSYWSLTENGTAIVCEMLYLRDTRGADEKFKGARLCSSEAAAYFEALAVKRPIVADRVLTHPATMALAETYLKPLGISSMLDAPVWVRGEVVGVLCHEHTGPAREWSAAEIDFVSALAAMVSLALEESRRARSEHLLRESEEKFRALFEGTSQPVVLHDENGIFEANPSWFRHLGYSRLADVIGKHPAELSAPIQPGGERAEVLAQKHINNALANGSARFEWMILRHDGMELPIEVFLTPIQLGGRQVVQAVYNDITERKGAETKLRESEARLRESEARFSTAFRASPVLITISRLRDARFIEANEAFIQWIGLERDQIIGRDSLELGLWVDLDERVKFLEELQRAQSLRDVERQFRSRRGSIHTMQLSADLIEINREPHVLVFGLDVTQRKQAEAEMLRTLAREKELGQLRSNFVSMVSHEFRTPLGIIQSSAEILEDFLDKLEPAERKDHLQSIHKNTRRMAGLMEEVLLIGRIDAGKMEFKPAPMDLRTFSRRLVDEVLSATDWRCPIELSLAEIPLESHADERLLRHIFTNLLTNAVKYSDAGCAVRMEIGRDGADMICGIRDQGIGIPENDREWLFSAFHRGGNVGDRPGTGLGLVIVKRCVDLHGGRIHVESKLGEGTTMTVKLPYFCEDRASPYSLFREDRTPRNSQTGS